MLSGVFYSLLIINGIISAVVDQLLIVANARLILVV